MNFKIINSRRFSVGVDVYKRMYYAQIKNNGLIRISHVLSGKVLFDNVDPDEILIDASLMLSINELQQIIYNTSCDCDSEEEEEFKIFDRTFDNTFE
ncbi:hypothetical protein D1632_10840 [Chryseobacterium nematophagum]|uniref:Uncharacterized protein n=1 Tax=Chryseobacterium nematophagum TaxID=2305228 RepID=A0A3M7LC18_9FLAO|nr:hypothetical protein [Chryseobacterium nematophagum]RMZ60077.1 hypothetical protein D1632_10840 [Chryseobacterium nematophagum]